MGRRNPWSDGGLTGGELCPGCGQGYGVGEELDSIQVG